MHLQRTIHKPEYASTTGAVEGMSLVETTLLYHVDGDPAAQAKPLLQRVLKMKDIARSAAKDYETLIKSDLLVVDDIMMFPM